MSQDAKVHRPLRHSRRALLGLLLRKHGGPKALAAELGSVDTHLTAIEKGRREVGDDLAVRMERLAGWPDGLADSGLTEREMQLLAHFRRLPDEGAQLEAIGVIRGMLVVARPADGPGTLGRPTFLREDLGLADDDAETPSIRGHQTRSG